MVIRPALLFLAAWSVWMVFWGVAAFWSARTEKRRSGPGVWAYRALVTVGAVLLWHRTSERLGAGRLWHVGYAGAYALAGLAFAFILFTFWARLHLGPLWSGSITRKEGHQLIETGPYALVRHPIYTGIIGAVLASALAISTWPALAGFALITTGLWMKARLEEQFLATELGADAYKVYRRRVPMLIPFVPARH
jgi:protein-S-isoprenylcysteine O-methyltransferase Ste14